MSYLYIIVLVLILLLIIGNVFTSVLQGLFIFRPIKLKKDYQFKFDLPFEEITLNTTHHGRINMLWFHDPEVKRPLVLYSHGNSSNLSMWGEHSKDFDKYGFDVLIYDYRGFGKSRGVRNEETFCSDAFAVYDFARQYYSPDNIVLYGRSMGTGVATLLAAERKARLLILEAPYHSIRDLFKTYYPFLPAFIFSFKFNFPTNEWIRKAQCPAYIFQGTRDKMIPYHCAVKLKPLMKNPENFITINGAGHNNLAAYDDYNENLKHILRNVK